MKRMHRFLRYAASIVATGVLFQASGCPIDTQALRDTLTSTLNTTLQTFISDLLKP